MTPLGSYTLSLGALGLASLLTEEVLAVQRLADEVHRMAIRLGGTTTGEHGVGLARAPYMPREHGEALAQFDRIERCPQDHRL